MSNTFAYEIGSVAASVERAHPGHADGVYAIPWYLVIGDPGSGRSTAIRSMQLTWSFGDGPLKLNVPQELCTTWMAAEAVFIEPGSTVLGPRRNPELLKELCRELSTRRPREAVDGLLLVLNVVDFADLDERGVDSYANVLRAYLIEVGRELRADVPVYVIVTRYDTLWGFAEVFGWTAERKGEDPWGFTLPGDTQSQQAGPRIQEELGGLLARFEAFCLAKLSSEDPPEQRTRAFQHLVEVRAMMDKLAAVLGVIAMANSFERAPWIRALAIGSAIPGTGDKLRAGVARLMQMGLLQPGEVPPRATRPGGLPIFSFMKSVVLPERDLVPTRVRWRDDPIFVWTLIGGAALFVVAVLAAIVLALTG